MSGGTLEIRVRERKRSGAAGDTIKRGCRRRIALDNRKKDDIA